MSTLSMKPSPHVFVKKSVSLRGKRGSLRAAGRFTCDINTVHLCWSSTTDGWDEGTGTLAAVADMVG